MFLVRAQLPPVPDVTDGAAPAQSQDLQPIESALTPFAKRIVDKNETPVYIASPTSIVVDVTGVVFILEDSQKHFCLHRFEAK